MLIQDAVFKLFEKTGKISYYLLYRELDRGENGDEIGSLHRPSGIQLQ